MFSVKDKNWFKSKTFWTAIVTFIVAGLTAIGYVVPDFVLQALVAFGLYSLRDAVGSKDPDT